jgi:signal transduction histidine kinase
MHSTRHYRITTLLAVGVAFALAFVTTLYNSGPDSVDFFCYLILLVLCGSLFVSLKAMTVIVIAISTGLFILSTFSQVSTGNVSPGYFVIVSGSILLATHYRNWLERNRRAKMEGRLARRNRELELLNSAGQALSASLDLDQVLTTVLEEIRHLLGVVASSVWLIDSESELQEDALEMGELVCQQATGPQSETVIGWRLAPGQGLVGHVAYSGKSLIVSDVRNDKRHFKGVDERTGLALRSILSVPLQAKGEVIGVLQVVDGEMDSLKPADLALVESLAATAAIAIENARLFAQEEQRAAELARALEQQRELDRLKDEFIQNVSHELRTPLTIARGYAELLNCGKLGTLQPKQQESVAIIARHTNVLSELVNDIVTFLDVERQMLREPVDMVSLVQAALADWQTRISAEEIELTLTTQVTPDLPLVLGAPVQLKRVLDNLLGNAYKFTPAGGRVAVQLKKNGTGVVLEVTDTGIGIPSDQLEQVFGRFYQVDGGTTRRYGGTGLGLALVKEIVEAHSGQVAVQSAVGEGSTFRVTLPAWSDGEQFSLADDVKE